MSRTAAILRVGVSFVLAADAVAVLVALADMGAITAAPVVLLVTGTITLFVATPAYLVLRLYWRETWRSCVAAGFFVGAIVAACVLLPVSWSEQFGREMTVIAGVRTAAGWRMYANWVCFAGGIGAGAGGVFWATLRLLERGARWPRLGRLPLTMGISLAIAASWTIFAIPSLTMDHSCHNVFRDGRRGISPVLFFSVELPEGEWPRFQDTAESFAGNEQWNIDKSNAKDKAFSPGRFVSVCIEPGTESGSMGQTCQALTGLWSRFFSRRVAIVGGNRLADCLPPSKLPFPVGFGARRPPRRCNLRLRYFRSSIDVPSRLPRG